jgi:hypothetical protein
MDQPTYFSYILRLWPAESCDPPQWRASLENTRSGERTGFSNLEALFEYLKQQAGIDPGTKEARPAS